MKNANETNPRKSSQLIWLVSLSAMNIIAQCGTFFARKRHLLGFKCILQVNSISAKFYKNLEWNFVAKDTNLFCNHTPPPKLCLSGYHADTPITIKAKAIPQGRQPLH